jgi:fatty acid desaturase
MAHALLARFAIERLSDERPNSPEQRKEVLMLWTIAVVLLILWFLGLVTVHALGGFIHILLFLAIAAILIRLIQGRRVL